MRSQLAMRPQLAVLIVGLGLSAGGCAGMGHGEGSDFQTIRIDDAPSAVQAAVHREFPGATIKFVGRHHLGAEEHYHVELTTTDGRTVYRTYSPEGVDMSQGH